jgi:hypothetical protein
MEYTKVLDFQRALNAVHQRDKRNALHVSYAEIKTLVERGQEMLEEIESDGNEDITSAATASQKKRGIDVSEQDGVDAYSSRYSGTYADRSVTVPDSPAELDDSDADDGLSDDENTAFPRY